MRLDTLPLITEEGATISFRRGFGRLWRTGLLLKDLIHRRLTLKEDLLVTLLTPKVTKRTKQQVEKLVRLLVLNYPALLHHGEHNGLVRYTVDGDGAALPDLRLTPQRRLIVDCTAGGAQPGPGIDTHHELYTAVASEVGSRQKLLEVHPHPRLSRVACLRRGQRKWKLSRSAYKKALRIATTASGLARVKANNDKWQEHGQGAAPGIASLAWRKIRRIVGLTPWGEQVLFRLKHHALSSFVPGAGHTGCPHQQCRDQGPVTLHHVFWDCPAAAQLRSVLLARWRSAGLPMAHYEEQIFGLKLPQMPAGIMKAVGILTQAWPDAKVEDLADSVEEIVEGCWSLDCALYFHVVWRWRVAHFDAANDVSQDHYKSGLDARIRNGHRDVAHGTQVKLEESFRAEVAKAICMTLGTHTPGSDVVTPRTGGGYLIFTAGHTSKETMRQQTGVVVARTNMVTGDHEIVYAYSTSFEGRHVTTMMAIYLGLLRAFRMCTRHGWAPTHLSGSHARALTTFMKRTAPRHAKTAGAYWKARRAADANHLESCYVADRECNRTAHSLAQMETATGAGMEWIAHESPKGRTKWAGLFTTISMDVEHWIQEQHAVSSIEPVARAV